MPGKKKSNKDFANKIGESTSLAFYILIGHQNEKRISPEVFEKSTQTTKNLNFSANQILRSLKKGTTNTIGFIVADLSNRFIGQSTRIIKKMLISEHCWCVKI